MVCGAAAGSGAGAASAARINAKQRTRQSGQEAEMPHAHEPFWEHMQQEAADEFLPAQGHHLVTIVVTVVLVAHVHRGVVFIEAQQSTVGQGDAMAVERAVGSVLEGGGVGRRWGQFSHCSIPEGEN